MAQNTAPSAADIASAHDQACALAAQFASLVGLGDHTDHDIQRSLATQMTKTARQVLEHHGDIRRDHPPTIWEGGLALPLKYRMLLKNIWVFPPITMRPEGQQWQQYLGNFMRKLEAILHRYSSTEQIVVQGRSAPRYQEDPAYIRAVNNFNEVRREKEQLLNGNSENRLAWERQGFVVEDRTQPSDDTAALPDQTHQPPTGGNGLSTAVGHTAPTQTRQPSQPLNQDLPPPTTTSPSAQAPTPSNPQVFAVDPALQPAQAPQPPVQGQNLNLVNRSKTTSQTIKAQTQQRRGRPMVKPTKIAKAVPVVEIDVRPAHNAVDTDEDDPDYNEESSPSNSSAREESTSQRRQYSARNSNNESSSDDNSSEEDYSAKDLSEEEEDLLKEEEDLPEEEVPQDNLAGDSSDEDDTMNVG